MADVLAEPGKRRHEFHNLQSHLGAPVAGAALAVISGFQLWWFSRTCFNEIDYDGISYIGIARHIRQGEFHSAVNAFRSPLMSWLIAAVPSGNHDYLHIGKLVNIASFLLTLVLLYSLAQSLWHSQRIAAWAALLFAVGRGLAAAAVQSVTPDFLFAALTLVYFLLLLRALRKDRVRDWLLLGIVHGVAFLAKAFALPWLAVCTVIALAVSGKPWKTRMVRLAAAALVPAMIAGGWAAALQSKYGVFTFGTQFKTNYLQWTVHIYGTHRDPPYLLLTDTARQYDEYVVGDPMPPGSWAWAYRIRIREALPKIILAEERNIPGVLKEMTIVATPGGLLAFVLALVMLVRRRHQSPVEFQFAAVVAVAALSLVTAYCMLCFDGRYLFPLIPLVLAISARFLAGEVDLNLRTWRRVSVALVVAGALVSLTYRSSPFRTLTRDFQVACYDAGNRLKAHNVSSVVSLGSGPFPEHGVGWEAGYKAAYFGGRRIIGAMDSLPDATQTAILMKDVEKASPDAILVWGKADDARRASVIQSLVPRYRPSATERIHDPSLGEVGIVMFR